MFEIRGFSISSNTSKTLYVAEALQAEYTYIPIDFSTGEHKSPEHLQRHPLGKLPTLTHKGEHLFESNAICSYMAIIENSALYPDDDPLYRTRIDQWLNFFSNHLGRWLNSYAMEVVLKPKFNFGEPNLEAQQEALKFITEQMPAVDKLLKAQTFFMGEQETIADYVAFAYIEVADMANITLSDYPGIERWYLAFKEKDSIKRAHKTLGRK